MSNQFQSAPGLTVGRCKGEQAEYMQLGFVSIRARPHGRAMRRAPDTKTPWPRCFNPRPASRSGDAKMPSLSIRAAICFNPRPASRSGDAPVKRQPADRVTVSIRARPHGRAMR